MQAGEGSEIVKIQNLKTENIGEKSRISADIIWEQSARAGLNVFFETRAEYGNALYAGFEPFLVGCILPALHHGEKRILIEGAVCPDLRQNLNTAMTLIRHWYYEPSLPLVTIEAAQWSSLPDQPHVSDRAGFFLSGGIDSLGTLQSNHANFPSNHPAAIRDGLLIYGQNIENKVRPEIFQQAFDDLSGVAADKGTALIPVNTNIRLVDDSPLMFYLNHGAILGSVAHAFSNRLNRVYISASDSIPALATVGQLNLKPHGSHPLLDPFYSSYRMTIKHDGIAQSRLDKVLQLSDWNKGLQAIRVCSSDWPGKNCCKCEKCVRTMLELLAAGLLHKTQAFAIHDVTTEMISRIKIYKPRLGYSVDDDYLELIGPLERIGRQDLAKAILAMIDRSYYPNKSLKQKMRRLDEKYLDGSLGRIKKKIMPKNTVGSGHP